MNKRRHSYPITLVIIVIVTVINTTLHLCEISCLRLLSILHNYIFVFAGNNDSRCKQDIILHKMFLIQQQRRE